MYQNNEKSRRGRFSIGDKVFLLKPVKRDGKIIHGYITWISMMAKLRLYAEYIQTDTVSKETLIYLKKNGLNQSKIMKL